MHIAFRGGQEVGIGLAAPFRPGNISHHFIDAIGILTGGTGATVDDIASIELGHDILDIRCVQCASILPDIHLISRIGGGIRNQRGGHGILV